MDIISTQTGDIDPRTGLMGSPAIPISPTLKADITSLPSRLYESQAGQAIQAATEFFGKNYLPTITNGPSSRKRIPFTFTSTNRLISSKAINTSITHKVLQTDKQRRLKEELAVIEKGVKPRELLGTLGLSPLSALAQPILSMMVNPHTVAWAQGKRLVKRDTTAGSVYFHFLNERGENNDILTMTFTGSTGNINTQNGIDNSVDTGADLKLRAWHQLYQLTREPMLLEGKIENQFFITYQTVLMPIPITLIGFYATVLSFTESASQPYMRDYSFQFTVIDTSPKLYDLAGLLDRSLLSIGSEQDGGTPGLPIISSISAAKGMGIF